MTALLTSRSFWGLGVTLAAVLMRQFGLADIPDPAQAQIAGALADGAVALGAVVAAVSPALRIKGGSGHGA